MKWFCNLPIRARLTSLTVGMVGLVVLLTFVAVATLEDRVLAFAAICLLAVIAIAFTYWASARIVEQYLRSTVRRRSNQDDDDSSDRTKELESRATELAYLNRQLEHERYLLQSLMDNIPDSIYFKDLQSRFVRINDGMAVRFDLKDANDALGKTDFDLFAEEHARPAFEDEQRIIKTGQPIIGLEEKEVWLDGRAPRWVLTTKMPLRNEQGGIIGTFGLSRDITDMKASQLRLAQQAEQLLALNEQLAQSNKDLDDFAYIASHDLKEPLRGISGYAHFLMEDYGDKLGPDARKQLRTLEDLCKRMENLIDALLEFSRVGRADLAVRSTDLNSLIKDVVEMMRPTMEQENVRLQIEQLPTIDCDAIRVRQLLHNLVSNAIKYNEKEEKLIEIGCCEGDQPEADTSLEKPRPLRFYVRDNGIGIRDKHLSAIFRIFKRLHGRDKYGGGTGAGLTFAKQIVERHGGKIWAESTVGEGTTFYFTLQQD